MGMAAASNAISILVGKFHSHSFKFLHIFTLQSNIFIIHPQGRKKKKKKKKSCYQAWAATIAFLPLMCKFFS